MSSLRLRHDPLGKSFDTTRSASPSSLSSFRAQMRTPLGADLIASVYCYVLLCYWCLATESKPGSLRRNNATAAHSTQHAGFDFEFDLLYFSSDF